MLNALDVEDALRASGYDDVVIATSCEQASEWLGRNDPAAVVVDVIIGGRDCGWLVEELARREVPTVVYTGLHRADTCKLPKFRGLNFLYKPASPERLVQAIAASVAGGE